MDPATNRHWQKVKAHAAQRLDALAGLATPEQIAAQLRAFLRVEDERLKIAYRCGAAGSWTVWARSLILDHLVERAFEAANWTGDERLRLAQASCAVVAIGGYGRRELCFCSDIDLLLLHTGRRATLTRQLVEQLLRLLWDAGLTVGHSFHTISEALHAAREDPHLQTALFSARSVAGNLTLFNGLEAALEVERERRRADIMNIVREERQQRRRQHGAEILIREPHLKEGCGGLRDLHSALWAAWLLRGCRSLDEAAACGLLSEAEGRKIARAREFLLRTRCEAHLLGGRRADRLNFELQPELAARLGYRADARLTAAEKFMRDYYRHTANISRFCDRMLAAKQESARARWFPWRRAGAKLFVKDGVLRFDGDLGQELRSRPMFCFDIFARAAEMGVGLSAAVAEELERNLSLFDRRFRQSPEAARAFLRVLRQPGRVAPALRLMRDVGFLGRYLPEFERINSLIQHDLYHHYTIDEHTLKAIEALDQLCASRDEQRAPWRNVFDQIEDIGLLYLAVLLHDLGKGQGKGHAARGARMAARICRRLHFDATSSAKVTLLVKHHLLMAHLAQRRDLSDPQVISRFASQVASLDALNMLLLLTYADLSGVAPGVWSDWKGRLLWELYTRARQALTGESLTGTPSEKLRRKERVVELLQGTIAPSEIERHFALLPERYALAFDAQAIALHLRLISAMGDSWQCAWCPLGCDATELVVCARDRHALFADIAGTLTANGIEILSAELHTREDGVVVDQFVLREIATHQAVDERRREKIERELEAAIAGKLDVAALVERWRERHAPRRRPARAERSPTPHVRCDGEAAQAYTVLEVCVADEPGLAYRIARIVAGLGVEIVCARVSTEKHYALDVFYVTDEDGKKLAAEREEELRRALAAELKIELSSSDPKA
mgnify:CR=1 FL=1